MDGVTLTGVADTDRYILSFLTDRELLDVSSADRYIRSLCDGENGIWHQRLRTMIESTIQIWRRPNGLNWNALPPNRYKELLFLYSRCYDDKERLNEVVRLGAIDLVEYFLTNHGSWSSDYPLTNPLTIAAKMGNMDVLTTLLGTRGDSYVMNDGALIEAGQNGHTEILKLLFDLRMPNKTFPHNLLRNTALGGHLSTVSLLILYGLDSQLDEVTIVDIASKGHLDILQLFWSIITPERKNEIRPILFVEASSNDNVNVLEFLIEKTTEPDVLLRSINGSLIHTVQNGSINALRLLMSHRHPLSRKTATEFVIMCASTNHIYVMEFLLQQDVDIADIAELLAQTAVRSHQEEMLNFLLKKIEFDEVILSELLELAINQATVEIVTRLMQEGAVPASDRPDDEFMEMVEAQDLNKLERLTAANLLPPISNEAIVYSIRREDRDIFDYLLKMRKQQQVEHPTTISPYLGASIVTAAILTIYRSLHSDFYFLEKVLNYPAGDIDEVFSSLGSYFEWNQPVLNNEIFNAFISLGADLNGEAGDLLLESVIRNGVTDVAINILMHNRGHALRSPRGHRALIDAIRYNNQLLIQWLIDADINLKTNNDEAFLVAVEVGNLNLVSTFLENRIIEDNNTIQDAMLIAADKSNISLVELLSKYGGRFDKDVLINAVEHNDLRFIEILLSYSFEPKVLDEALRRAITAGNFDIVVVLLKENTNPNVVEGIDLFSEIRKTADRNLIIELLLQQGLNANNDAGLSMLKIAIDRNYKEIAMLLLYNGVIPTHQSLLSAISKRQVSIIKRIIALGVNPHANNDEAFILARKTRDAKVYSALM